MKSAACSNSKTLSFGLMLSNMIDDDIERKKFMILRFDGLGKSKDQESWSQSMSSTAS